LLELGFSNVVHECRDFYQDIENHTIPHHDTFVSNPPYSDQHKEKCLEFVMEQLHTKDRPFFILMPNYVAAREYYRKLVEKVWPNTRSRRCHWAACIWTNSLWLPPRTTTPKMLCTYFHQSHMNTITLREPVKPNHPLVPFGIVELACTGSRISNDAM
jgi:hypothetical protein